MNDPFEQLWQLEQQQFKIYKEFNNWTIVQQIDYLKHKLDFSNYQKLKTDFFLELLETYDFDDEVFIGVWQIWLKNCLYHELQKRNGIVNFLNRNPQLKSQVISQLNDLIDNNPIHQYTKDGEGIDEVPIYNAVLLLWELNYKTALKNFIKKHQAICDLYLDNDDYQAIDKLIETG